MPEAPPPEPKTAGSNPASRAISGAGTSWWFTRGVPASSFVPSSRCTTLGVHRALAQRPHARPAPGEPRRELNPRVAGRDKWKRIEAIGRLKVFLNIKAFLNSYRVAWRQFAIGTPGAVFPHGTYWMRIAYGVECGPARSGGTRRVRPGSNRVRSCAGGAPCWCSPRLDGGSLLRAVAARVDGLRGGMTLGRGSRVP